MQCIFRMNEAPHLRKAQSGGWGGWRIYNVQDYQTADLSLTPQFHVGLGLGKKSTLAKVRER